MSIYGSLYNQSSGVPAGQSGAVPSQLNHLVRYPFVFLIDISGSTGAGPDPDIGHINAAINQLVMNVKHPPQSSPLRHQNKQVDVCVLAYNNDATVVQDWELASQLPATLPVMKAGGGTAMGHALKQAIKKIRERHSYYDQHNLSSGRCHIIHITDGGATDMSPGDATWQSVTKEIHKLDGTDDPENQKAAMIHFCSPNGITSAGINTLQQLSGQKSVYALGTEVQKFDGVVEMVTGIISRVSGATESEQAIAGAAGENNFSSMPIEVSGSQSVLQSLPGSSQTP
jgi:uncharacterized protein YegL